MIISALMKLLNPKSGELRVDEAIDVEQVLKRMHVIVTAMKLIWTFALGAVYCVGVMKAVSYEEMDTFLGLLIFLWPLSVIGSLIVYKRDKDE